MRRLSQKQIEKRLDSAEKKSLPVFLIKDEHDSDIYYICPIGWDRESAEQANSIHRHNQAMGLKYLGVEQYDPDCLSFLRCSDMKIYDLAYLPVHERLVDFYPRLLDGIWRK